MAVDPLHEIGCRERQHAGKHFVEGDAERIEVAARIDRSVHAAGLLGRHVGKRSANDLGRWRWRWRWLLLARLAGGYPEAREPQSAAGVNQNIRRLDIFVNKAVAVHLAQECRQRNREVQELAQLERTAEKSIERL